MKKILLGIGVSTAFLIGDGIGGFADSIDEGIIKTDSFELNNDCFEEQIIEFDDNILNYPSETFSISENNDTENIFKHPSKREATGEHTVGVKIEKKIYKNVHGSKVAGWKRWAKDKNSVCPTLTFSKSKTTSVTFGFDYNGTSLSRTFSSTADVSYPVSPSKRGKEVALFGAYEKVEVTKYLFSTYRNFDNKLIRSYIQYSYNPTHFYCIKKERNF